MADVGAQGLPADSHSIVRRPGGGRSPRATTICCGSRLSGSKATQYALYRRQGGSTTLVDEVHAVPAGVTVTTGGVTDVEFTFVGEALASYTITRAGAGPHVDRHGAASHGQSVRAIVGWELPISGLA